MKKYFAGLAGALVLAATAHAEQVTYNYSGYVSFIYKYDHSLPWPTGANSVALSDGSVQVMQAFHGQFSYDTSTILQPGAEWEPTYSGAAPQNSASISFDNGSVSYQSEANSPKSKLHIYDQDPYVADQLNVITATGSRNLQFNLVADNDHILNGNRIPANLSRMNNGSYLYFGGDTLDGNTFTAFGAIAALDRVGAVPEPQTWAMLIAGLALIGWRQRRKQAC